MSIADDVLLQHLTELIKGQARIEAKVDAMIRTVDGNGQPGLVQKVEELQGSKNWLWGAIAAMGSLLGAGGALEWLFHHGRK